MTDKRKRRSKTTENSDYDRIISDASNAISRLFESDYVELLDKRSRAQAMKSQFAGAERDAREMIKYSPHSGRGYVRAGEIYTMQGKQDKAVENYAEGHKAVAKTDPYYKQLIKDEKLAKEKANFKTDMIARLPLETTFNIFDRLPLESAGTCLNVSKVWRQRLAKCATAWHTLTVQGSAADMAISNAIPEIGAHVKTLKLACKTKQLRAIYWTHMREGYFTNLTKLIVTKEMTYTVNRELIALALWETRKTLTHLDIDLSDSKVLITVPSILISSPNLTCLFYKVSSALRRAVGDPSGLLKPLKLKQLRLQSDLVRGEDVFPILSKGPELRTLALFGCETSILDTVLTTCKNLEYFGYNDDPLTGVLPASANRQQSTGLKILKIATPVPLTEVMPFLVEHCNTLRQVHLQLTELFDDGLSLSCPIMKELRLLACAFSVGTEPVVAKIIKECPELRFVYFENVDNMDILSRELLKAEKLAKLSIVDTHCPLENELQRLFDKHVLLGQESSLAIIRFTTCYTVSDAVLAGLRGLKALTTLELNSCEGMTVQGLAGVIRDLKTLKDIKLSQMNWVNDTVINALRHVPIVRLTSLNHVTDTAVRNLVTQSECLQTLELRSCSRCSPRTVLAAQAKGINVLVS